MKSDIQARFEKIFPHADPDEGAIIFARKHWFIFFLTFLIILLMLIMPAIILAIVIKFLPGFFTGSMLNILIIFSSMYILFVLAISLIGFINLYFDILIVTNRRIIDINQEGLFHRTIDELDILHVEDARASVRGILGTFFDYGQIEVQTAGTARNFIFDKIAHPRVVSQTILDQYQKALRNGRRNEARRTDEAEGLGARLTPLTFNERHGMSPIEEEEKPSEEKPEEKISTEEVKPLQEFKPEELPKTEEKPQASGNLEEGKVIDFRKAGFEDKVLLKFNLPKSNLDKVLDFLPSIKSPTINELADKNFIAIETVVKKIDIDIILQKLKDYDASGIIQTDIKVL